MFPISANQIARTHGRMSYHKIVLTVNRVLQRNITDFQECSTCVLVNVTQKQTEYVRTGEKQTELCRDKARPDQKLNKHVQSVVGKEKQMQNPRSNRRLRKSWCTKSCLTFMWFYHDPLRASMIKTLITLLSELI